MQRNKIVFLFSGQGSHYRGMGRKLFENNSVFRASLEDSEVIVQKHINRSLIDELYFINHKGFDDVLITHPAIVAIEIAMYMTLKSMDITPDYVCGNSLGEFAAAVMSGIWDAETALEASIEQAKFITQNNITGGMLAIIDPEKTIKEHNYLERGLFLAADNFEGHYTLSGTAGNLDAYQSELSELGIQFLRLPVKVPFHSPLILKALKDFNCYMARIPSLQKPIPGFISGIQCKELDTIPTHYFWQAVSVYINYPKMVSYIENKGSCLYIDLGPSGTSATFVKYNLNRLSTSKTFQIMTLFNNELKQLERLKEITSLTQI